MKHMTGAPSQRRNNNLGGPSIQRHHAPYGPLLRIAVEIAATIDGKVRSQKTAYSVMREWMTSAVMSEALDQARHHPEYLAWKREHRQRLRQALAEAQLRLLRAEGHAA
jgi:hypothetical protein